MSEVTISDLTLHPACNKVPRMLASEWALFVEDVRRRGVQEPIVVQRGGLVLDGRHRLEAAKARGDLTIPARLVDLSEQEQIQFVLGAAVLRRHLTDDQRSVLAARFQESLSKAAKVDRARKGGLAGGMGRPRGNGSSEISPRKLRPKADTRKEAAKHFQVSERQTRSASTIQRESPDLAERVLAGELTLPQAQRELRLQQKRAELAAKAKQAEAAPGDHRWQFLHGDCLKILPTLTEKARLVFADPPYNIGIDYGDGGDADKRPPENYLAWCRQWIGLCAGCLTDDGSLWIMINDAWADHFGILLREVGLHRRAWIKWYETFGVNCSNNFNRCSRHIFYCVKDPKHFVFNPDAVSRPSDRQTKYSDKRAAPGGKIWDDVWQVPRLTGTCAERVPGFPTQVPLAIARAIVGCASEPGDLVIDPFSGSASTGVAAVESARRFVGIEQSDQYIEMARLRLKGVETLGRISHSN